MCTYSKVANKRAGRNKRVWRIFFKKIIYIQGQISMEGGNLLTLKNMDGEITYNICQILPLWLPLVTTFLSD